MSKAARIRELLAQGLSTREVAEQVGCDPAYVRVAGRQRAATGRSDADTRWIMKRYSGGGTIKDAWRNQARERYANPERYAKFMAYQRDWLARRANQS